MEDSMEGLEARIGELEAKVDRNTATLAELTTKLEDVVEATGETRGRLLEQNVEENLEYAFTGLYGRLLKSGSLTYRPLFTDRMSKPMIKAAALELGVDGTLDLLYELGCDLLAQMSLRKLEFLILVEVSVVMDLGRVRKALERSKLLRDSLAAVGRPTKVLPCVVGQNFQPEAILRAAETFVLPLVWADQKWERPEEAPGDVEEDAIVFRNWLGEEVLPSSEKRGLGETQ